MVVLVAMVVMMVVVMVKVVVMVGDFHLIITFSIDHDNTHHHVLCGKFAFIYKEGLLSTQTAKVYCEVVCVCARACACVRARVRAFYI